MTPSRHVSYPALTGPQKAASFLMGLGDQLSAEVLRHLSPEEVRAITSAIATTRSVGAAQMLSVFREFEALTAEGRLFAKGGAECARRLVEGAFGQQQAHEFLPPPPSSEPQPGAANVLEEAEPEQLANFLKSEHPQTIAVVLANISAERGGAVMKALPEEIQTQAAVRMASLDRIPPDVFQKVSEVIGGKLKSVRQGSKANGVGALAAMLNHVDAELAEGILARVEEQNRPAADTVRNLSFVFDDVLLISKEGMKSLVAALDRNILTLALKGTKPSVRNHFMQCMSSRGSEMLIEDMEALGAVRVKEVKNAQQQVVAVVRQLRQAGKINLDRGKEEYVV